jgi:subtilisin-like proprotein convertase family protein
MKCLLPALLLLLSLPATAQNVGIGTITPTDQLHTTGTVRFEGYRGPGTRLVQIDSAGRMVATGAGTIASATPYVTIPDNGCTTGNGITSTITISGQPTAIPASRISVRVNITHPSANDVRMILVAPNGTSLLLMGGVVSGGSNFVNTVFTDAALATLGGTASQAPYTGTFKPIGAMGTFCLLNNTVTSFGGFGGGSIVPNGAWTLKVYDGTAGITGTFNSWDISFSGAASFLTAEQNNYVPVFNRGNLDASSIYQDGSGNIGIRTTSPLTTLQVSDQSNDVMTLENTGSLSAGTNTFLNFKAGNNFTGRIGTAGTDAQSASLGFYTSAGGSLASLQKRMSILDGGNVGIGIADASVSERVHIDGGNIKLGLAAWGSATNDRFLKFGDGNFVTIGETGVDDRLQLTADRFVFKRLTGNTLVGINMVPTTYNFDVTGTGRFSGTLTLSSGSPTAGKVLTATNANGDATWSNLPAYNTGFSSTVAAASSVSIDFSTGATQTAAFKVNSTPSFDNGNNFSNTAYSYTVPATGIYAIEVKINGAYNSYFVGTLTANQNGGVVVSLRKGTTVIDGHTSFYGNGDKIVVNAIIANKFQLTQGDVLTVEVQAYGAVPGGIPYLIFYNNNFSGNRIY